MTFPSAFSGSRLVSRPRGYPNASWRLGNAEANRKGEAHMTHIRHWLLVAAMCFAGTGVTAQNTTSLTDSQIAHVYYTAGQVDIAAANLALRHSANNAVRAFANATLRDYTAASKAAASSL